MDKPVRHKMRPPFFSDNKPFFSDNMKIGLFGGSFNPPHKGHAFISERLRIKLNLDLIWWLVSPQNPLKKTAPENINTRIAACQRVAGHHKVYISDAETHLQTSHTADTIRLLKAKYPNVHFIWLMGADNMRTVHHWRNWKQIFYQVPIAVYPRPSETVRAGLGISATVFAQHRLPPQNAHKLIYKNKPAWTLLEGRTNALSSTILRENNSPK